MRSGVYRRDEPLTQDVSPVGKASDDAALACVNRLLTSETFRRAPRLKGLLSYLWDCAATGRTAESTEQHIGAAVFGRPVDYDCANDNIVRVTVRQLRLKLQEYYETEGAAENERVVIPKGYYVPELVPRHTETQPIEVAQSRETHEPIDTRAPALASPSHPKSGLGIRFWRWVSVASIVLALCFGGLAIFASHSVRRVPVSQSNWLTTNNLVKALILVPRQKTPVILGDTGLEIAQEITGRDVPLDQYLNGNFERSLPQSGAPDEIARALIASRAIAVTEVAAASRILQANPEQVQSFFIGGPSSIEAQEFRSSNVILVGNSRSNPWISLVTPQLNFQVSYDKRTRATLIRDQKPEAGEPFQFTTQRAGQTEISYGLIAVVPNLSGTGSVLIITGTSSGAITSSTEFVCHPEAAQRVAGLFRIENFQQTSGFELILKVESVEGISRAPQVVASRVTLRTRG